MTDLNGLRWKPQESGLVVPDRGDVQDLETKLLREGPKCPAARLGRFTSGRAYVHCGVESRAFAVADSPVAAIKWCCGDYAGADGDSFGPCPVWMAEQEDDPALEALKQAKLAAEAQRLTERQVASGLRVDDRGLDPDLPQGTREVIEALEEADDEPDFS